MVLEKHVIYRADCDISEKCYLQGSGANCGISEKCYLQGLIGGISEKCYLQG